MTVIVEKKFFNNILNIELTSYLDNKQNIWFRGKDIAEILGYSDADQAIRKHVTDDHKRKQLSRQPKLKTGWTEFYELVFASKLETAKKFREWVLSQVLPSFRRYGQYKLFENPNDKMFKIENEFDLHIKVVQYVGCFYPEVIIIAGLGENQDTGSQRISSWKKGYMKGQPDIIIANQHEKYTGLCIEFRSPTNNHKISEA